MPAAPQRRLPEVLTFAALVAGVVLLVVGLIFAITIGPSGRFEVTTHVGEPGVVVIARTRSVPRPYRSRSRSPAKARATSP